MQRRAEHNGLEKPSAIETNAKADAITKKVLAMDLFGVLSDGLEADSAVGTGSGSEEEEEEYEDKKKKTPAHQPAAKKVCAVSSQRSSASVSTGLLDLPDAVLWQIMQQLVEYAPKAYSAAARACRRLYVVAMGRAVMGAVAVEVTRAPTLDYISFGAAQRVPGKLPMHLAPYGPVNIQTLKIGVVDFSKNQISRCLSALPFLRVLTVLTNELAQIGHVLDALTYISHAELEELTLRNDRELHGDGISSEILDKQTLHRLFFGGWLPNLRKLDIPFMSMRTAFDNGQTSGGPTWACPELTSACVHVADATMVLAVCRGLRKLTLVPGNAALIDTAHLSNVYVAISRAKRLMKLRLFGWSMRPVMLGVIREFVASRGEECVVGRSGDSAFERKYGTELCGGTLELCKCKFPANAEFDASYNTVHATAATRCGRPIRLVLRRCKSIRNETAVKLLTALGPCVGSLQLINTRLWTLVDAAASAVVVANGSRPVPVMPRVSALTVRLVHPMGLKYALRGAAWLPWKTSLRCITIDTSHSGRQRLDIGIPDGPLAVTNVAVMHSQTAADEGVLSINLVRLLHSIATLHSMTLENCGILSPSIIRRISDLVSAAPASIPDAAFVIRNRIAEHVNNVDVEDMFWTIRSLIKANGSARVPRMFAS